MQEPFAELPGGTAGGGCTHASGASQAAAVPAESEASVLQHEIRAPASCTVSWINFAGVAGLVAATLVLSRFNLPVPTLVLVTLAVPALVIIVLENIFVKARSAFRPAKSSGYKVAPLGLPQSQRIILKFVGLAGSIGVLAAIYWLFPVYRDGGAKDLLAVADRLLVPFLLLTPFYIWYVDKKSEAPEDGYVHVGLLLTGSWRLADRDLVRQHCLQWLVKAFFLPLMLSFYVNQITWLSRNPIENGLMPFLAEPNAATWLRLYHFLYTYLFLIDVGLGSVGYALTLKLFDSEVRSAEPTLLGWVVCLACYAPFWGLVSQQFLKYGTPGWEVWFGNWPAIKVLWSLMILFLVTVYVWATVQFGIRFSNLTHRGIITNGPYRWLKHPAYVSKNATFWLISIPFLAGGGMADSVRLSLLLVGVNVIYYLRAKTEESHLMIDPIYSKYIEFMRENDIFALIRRSLARRLPALRRDHGRT
jgi:protein-S-isoprenylcysteine O-methyltransferase Ste14